jgi:hypothetical protein
MAVETTANKQAFIHGLAAAATKLLEATSDIKDLSAIYTDRGYDPNHAGTDPIADETANPMGLTANQVYEMAVTLNTNLQAWLANNHTILNVMRRDK